MTSGDKDMSNIVNLIITLIVVVVNPDAYIYIYIATVVHCFSL